MSQPTVFMAGGGTGGHVFPLVAVAHALRRIMPEIRPIFIGTDRGMETQFVPEQGFELELLKVLPIRGAGVKGALLGVTRAATLLPEARALIKRYRPSAVFSIGGYAAGPISMAARTLGLPVALMEPNSVIGLANWLTAPFVQRAYTAFEITDAHFAPSLVMRCGVPLRPGFEPVPCRVHAGPLNVLVLGGSQGAKALNHVLPEALCRVSGLNIRHQCGRAHVETITRRYEECRALQTQVSRRSQVEIVPFIDDMATALAAADLVIGRAGAGAVSEIAAVGRASLLIPYPFASGDHQRINAETLEQAGAARSIVESEATADRIEQELLKLCADRMRLRSMSDAARRLGRPFAADVIARDFLELAGFVPALMKSLSEVA